MNANILLPLSEKAFMESLGFKPTGTSRRRMFFILNDIDEELFSFLVLKYSSNNVWER